MTPEDREQALEAFERDKVIVGKAQSLKAIYMAGFIAGQLNQTEKMMREFLPAARMRTGPYDPTMDYNRDPRCDCIHPESQHDPKTGKCLSVNPTFGPCPCRGELPAKITDRKSDEQMQEAL